MKNFDTDRQARKPSEEARTFQIGGEVFVLKSGIHPSVLEKYDGITPESNVKETLAIVDELIVGMIQTRDDAVGRYKAVRDQTEDPITVEDLQELVKWMVEVSSGERPTGPPGDSSPGPTRTGTPSTESSSPKAVSLVPTI